MLVDSSDKLEQKLILKQTTFSSGSFSPLVSHEKILFPTRLRKAHPDLTHFSKCVSTGKLSDLNFYLSLSSMALRVSMTQPNSFFFEVVAKSQKQFSKPTFKDTIYDFLVVVLRMQILCPLIEPELSSNKNNLCILRVRTDVLCEFPSAFSSGLCA